jgi:integrase
MANDSQGCVARKQPNDYVLTRDDGSLVLNFRKAWHRACIRAGLGKFVCPECEGEKGEIFPVDDKHACMNCGRKWKCQEVRYRGLLFHDLRRSMARNARNEGIAQEVIMEIGGWKTANVFRRYSIVNPADTAAAIRKVDARRQRDLRTIKSQVPQPVEEKFIQSFTQNAHEPVQPATSRSRHQKGTVLPN